MDLRAQSDNRQQFVRVFLCLDFIVCVYVLRYECVEVYMCSLECVRVRVCICICVCVCMFVCVFVCRYFSVSACLVCQL